MDRLIDIESFRKQNHITQTDIAEYLGISRSFVNQVENGKAALPESRLNELLEKSPKEKGWDKSFISRLNLQHLNKTLTDIFALSFTLILKITGFLK